jgi:hypothetical protein
MPRVRRVLVVCYVHDSKILIWIISGDKKRKMLGGKSAGFERQESGVAGQARSSSKFCPVKMPGSGIYINPMKMILRS